jgi:hypothetical protein
MCLAKALALAERITTSSKHRQVKYSKQVELSMERDKNKYG